MQGLDSWFRAGHIISHVHNFTAPTKTQVHSGFSEHIRHKQKPRERRGEQCLSEPLRSRSKPRNVGRQVWSSFVLPLVCTWNCSPDPTSPAVASRTELHRIHSELAFLHHMWLNTEINTKYIGIHRFLWLVEEGQNPDWLVIKEWITNRLGNLMLCNFGD